MYSAYFYVAARPKGSVLYSEPATQDTKAVKQSAMLNGSHDITRNKIPVSRSQPTVWMQT